MHALWKVLGQHFFKDGKKKFKSTIFHLVSHLIWVHESFMHCKSITKLQFTVVLNIACHTAEHENYTKIFKSSNDG